MVDIYVVHGSYIRFVLPLMIAIVIAHRRESLASIMECTTGLDSWLGSTSFEPPHGWIQSTSAKHERLVDKLNGSNFGPASSPVTVGN